MKDKKVFKARLLQMQCEMYAITTEVVAMQAANSDRRLNNECAAYDDQPFLQCKDQLLAIVRGIDNLINEHASIPADPMQADRELVAKYIGCIDSIDTTACAGAEDCVEEAEKLSKALHRLCGLEVQP